MTKVDCWKHSKTFMGWGWDVAFDAGEAKGLTDRVGPWRCAPSGGGWACLRDATDFPHGESFATRRDAINWMVDDCLASGFAVSPEQHGRE